LKLLFNVNETCAGSGSGAETDTIGEAEYPEPPTRFVVEITAPFKITAVAVAPTAGGGGGGEPMVRVGTVL
jgi:hypothetical protein